MLAAVVAFLGIAQVAEAQDYRAQRTFYVAPTIGISNYVGDLDVTPLNMDDWSADGSIPFSGALEAGYQVTTRFAIGGEYRIGNYPTVAPEDEYSFRHTASLVLRYTPSATETRLIPYIQGGLQGTVGHTTFYEDGDTRDDFAVGPWLGVGVDYSLNKTTSLFFGINSRMNVPDHGVDGFGNEVDERGRFDLLSDASLGLRYRFKPAWTN